MSRSRMQMPRVLAYACWIAAFSALSSCGDDDASGGGAGSSAGQAAAGKAGETPTAAGSSAAGKSGVAGMLAAGSGGRAGSMGAAGSAGGSPPIGGTHATYFVQDGSLYDRCGEKVVLRGVNHPTLYVDRKGEAMPEIAKTNANAVRLFWYATMRVAITEAESVISAAIANKMIPILEMHDSTCKWELDDIVSYWTSADAIKLITKHQANLIVNIANETSPPDSATFKSKYTSVIQTLRSAGIHVPLMIDGGNCGRDYKVLLSQGPALLQSDPDHNLIFSGHLYDPLSASQLGKVYDDFIAAKLPFVVGEFANKQPPGCGKALDYKSLIAEANKRGVGWLAWSWGDDDPDAIWNSDCDEFDMTSTFAYDSLENWGKEVAVTLPDSIMNTSKRPASLTLGKCQ